jgi:hypothetical protein
MAKPEDRRVHTGAHTREAMVLTYTEPQSCGVGSGHAHAADQHHRVQLDDSCNGSLHLLSSAYDGYQGCHREGHKANSRGKVGVDLATADVGVRVWVRSINSMTQDPHARKGRPPTATEWDTRTACLDRRPHTLMSSVVMREEGSLQSMRRIKSFARALNPTGKCTSSL